MLPTLAKLSSLSSLRIEGYADLQDDDYTEDDDNLFPWFIDSGLNQLTYGQLKSDSLASLKVVSLICVKVHTQIFTGIVPLIFPALNQLLLEHVAFSCYCPGPGAPPIPRQDADPSFFRLPLRRQINCRCANEVVNFLSRIPQPAPSQV